MAQKGTVGLLLIGGGVAAAYFTYQDLVNSQAQAQQAGAQAAAQQAGQSPFTPGGLSALANPPGANQGTGQNQTQTTCPPGQVSILVSGLSTRRKCVPANKQTVPNILTGVHCPSGQVPMRQGSGAIKCVPVAQQGNALGGRGQGQPYQPPFVGKNFNNHPCYFGFLFC